MNLSKLPAVIQKELPSVMDKFQINTRLRLSHFLAQCAHESGDFKVIKENMNYSVNGLLKTFHKYFKTKEQAEKYARQPEKIGNYVYANRMGNGDEASGDGYKHRGMGYLQTTGKENQNEFLKSIGEPTDNPEIIATKYPLLSAAWFWDVKSLNMLSDQNNLLEITKVINGGTNGLKDREYKFNKYFSFLS